MISNILSFLLSFNLFWNFNDDIQPIQNFDKELWQGRWFQAGRTKNVIYELKNMKNITQTFQLDDQRQFFEISYDLIRPNGNFEHTDGKGIFLTTFNIADLWFQYGNNIFEKYIFKIRQKIIETDYYNYAIMYSTFEILFFKANFVWIYTRKDCLDQSFIDQLILKAAKLMGNDFENYMYSKKTNC